MWFRFKTFDIPNDELVLYMQSEAGLVKEVSVSCFRMIPKMTLNFLNHFQIVFFYQNVKHRVEKNNVRLTFFFKPLRSEVPTCVPWEILNKCFQIYYYY